MRRRACIVLACLMLLACAPLAAAQRVLFYQPQRADLTVPESRWPALFAQVRAMGFDTLAVQWVAYGDAFSNEQERDWLERRLREAHASRLHLILGLGADPAFFERQKEDPARLRSYLETLSRTDLALARSWRERLGPGVIEGWYLPIEIDDLHWRDEAPREILLEHLRHEARALQGVQPGPVYLSSFFVGNMAPAAYARLLGQMQETGMRVWVQDGAGTGRLSRAERGLYLDALHHCPSPPARGIVYEVFRQTAHDKDFAAQPMQPARMREALAQQAPCGGDSVYFEMRYLPGMQSIRVDGQSAAGLSPGSKRERVKGHPAPVQRNASSSSCKRCGVPTSVHRPR